MNIFKKSKTSYKFKRFIQTLIVIEYAAASSYIVYLVKITTYTEADFLLTLEQHLKYLIICSLASIFALIASFIFSINKEEIPNL
jgi:hypothetical protein